MTAAIAIPATNGGLAIEMGSEEFEATCAHMAREFQAATAEIRRLAACLRDQSARLLAAFSSEMEGRAFSPFDVTLYHEGRRYSRCEVDDILDHMKREAWRMLFDRLGVKKLMSVAKREEFEKRLKEGELPDITEESLAGVILGMVDQAKGFAEEAAREVFEWLRPWRRDYKTNSAFRVGRRVILSGCVGAGYGSKFRVQYARQPKVIALDGVFHLMAGKGVMSDRLGPLVAAIEATKDGTGETEFFKFKCFKNGNLHVEFKRLDLVKQLNYLGAGERVLGADGM